MNEIHDAAVLLKDFIKECDWLFLDRISQGCRDMSHIIQAIQTQPLLNEVLGEPSCARICQHSLNLTRKHIWLS